MGHRHSLLWTHQGVSLPHVVTLETLEVLSNFQIRDDDVVVASYPKTGVNWLAEIAVSILRAGGKIDPEGSVDTIAQPLELKLPTATQPCYMKLADMSSPRIVLTHLPIQFAPQGISKPENKVKVLVTMRNPKDTAVSMFHFTQKVLPMMGENADLGWEEFAQDFSNGRVTFGDYCDHVSGWWQMRDDPHFLFLKYEDMKKDLLRAVKSIATFLEADLDEATIKGIAEASTFSNMKTVMDQSSIPMRRLIPRKGIVGDWKNTFSSEESDAFDAWYEKKLGGTGLTFDFE